MTNAKLTQDELQAIKSRISAVGNYGEWTVESDEEGRVNQAKVVADTYTVAIELDEQDAEFIAEARQDIPKLLSEIERLQAEVHEHSAHNGQLIATHVIPTKEENKRLRKALEYYADSRNYQEWRDGYAGSRGTSVEILRDYGRRAEEALRR